MNFVTQKILSALLLPVPISLIFLIIGFILLLCSHHGKGFILFGIIILLIFATPFIPNAMLIYLESQFKPLTQPPPNIKQIVVLGAGNGGYPEYPANDKLSAASLARLVEGIRIHRLIPNSVLILSGGRVFGSPPDANTMNNVATMLGVDPKEIKIENGSQDTFQEAINLKKIVGSKRFILVTSAYHMPRAVRLFEHQGMQPIAAPTEFLIAQKRYSIKQYFPNASNLLYSDIAIHEYLGTWWSQFQGKI